MARPPRPSWLYSLVAVLSWPVLKVAFRLRATGREHVPDGGCVVAANHWSNLDPWPLGVPLFPRRFLRFMAKKELFWPPLGWIVRAGGGFRVDRGRRDQQAIDTAIALCRQALLVEPEREDAHRRLMAAYARVGQRAQALRQFELCAEALRRRLQTLPSPETAALHERIRRGRG